MEKIIKFKAVDGTEFKAEEACLKYEQLIDDVADVMKHLKPIPKDDGCKFANGYYFIQQNEWDVKTTRAVLLNMILKQIDHKWVRQSIESDTVHPSWVARLLGETGLRPLSDAWLRISNIDKEFREWGQGYFVEHPEESQALKNQLKPIS